MPMIYYIARRNPVTGAIELVLDPSFNQTPLLISPTVAPLSFNTDSSNFSNDITVVGDTKASSYTPYLPNWSTYFDGTGDILTNTSGNPINFGTGNFTVELWFNIPTLPTTQYQVLLVTNPISNNGFQIYRNGINGNIVYGGVFLSEHTIISSANFTTNTWYHIAIVRQGTGTNQTKTYVNGVLSNTVTDAANYNINGFIIGGYADQIFFNGYISNLRVVKGTAVYTSNFTPSTTPLTAITGTSLLTCQNSTYVDNSLNKFAVSKVGDSQITPFNPFTTGTISTPTTYSTYFDGTGDYLTFTNTNNQISFGTNNFTIEFWVNFNNPATNTFEVLFRNYTTDPFSTDYFYLGKHTSASVPGAMSFWVGSYSGLLMLSDPTLPSAGWLHYAIVRNSNTWTMYRNGTSVHSVTSSVSMGTRNNNICEIGTFLTGYISNFRVVKGTAVYTSNFTPSTSPLTAITGTSLLTCQNATLIDNSTNAFAIASVGQAQPSAINPFGATTSSYSPTYSSALTAPTSYSNYFDGSGDYLAIANNTAFQLGTGDFTIEFWWNGSPTGSFLQNIGTLISSAELGTWRVGTRYNSTNAIYFAIGNGSGFTEVNYSTNVNDNAWHHIACVRISGMISMYVDGIKRSPNGSENISGTCSSTNELKIGYNQRDGVYITGYMSNVRVIKGTAVYTANFTPSTTPLTAISGTSLLTCQNLTFVDNSTNAFAITAYGNTTTAIVNPFGFTSTGTVSLTKGSAYFDGTGDYLISNNPDLAFGTGDFTVECWIYALAANDQAIYEGRLVNNNSTGFTLTALNSTTIRTYSNSVLLTATVPNYIGTWTHIAVTRSAGTSRLFVNGILGQSAASTTNFTDNRAIIGAGMYSGSIGSNAFNGFISDFRIVKGTAVYTANFTPSTDPLTATTNTVLLTCQNSNAHNNHTFVNSATNTSNLVLTRSGNATQGSLSPYSASWGGYFNGSTSYVSAPSNAVFGFGTGDFTIEAFVNPTSIRSGENIIYCTDITGGANLGYTQSQVYLSTRGVEFSLLANYVVKTNAWTHLAVTRQSDVVRIFADGVLIGSGNVTRSYVAGVASVGGIPTLNNYGITGYISNVRVVKGTAVYTANFTPSTSPLTAVAGTSLLTLQNDQFIDNSSNRFALTATGTPTTTLNNISSFALNTLPTPTSYSGYFNGTTDYLQLANNTAFQLDTGDFTIEFWWNGSLTGSYSQNIGTLISGAEAGTWRVGTINNSTNTLYFGRGNGSGFDGAFYSVNVNTNAWYHIACVRRSGVIYMYVNGVAQTLSSGSAAISGTCSSTNPLRIGYNQRDATYIAGYMSNVRVVKGTALYTANFTPATSPLTAISGTSLLTCQNSTFVDNSSNAFAITSTGAVKPSAINPFGSTASTANGYSVSKFKGSAYFDGSDTLTGTLLSGFGSGNFTIETWIYQTVTSVNRNILDTRAFNGSASGLSIEVDTSNRIVIYSTNLMVTSSRTITPYAWTHLALVRSAGVITCYINGVSSGTFSATTNYSDTALVIGSNQPRNNWFTGYIADVRIVVGSAVYTSNFLPPSAPLIVAANTTLLLDFAAGSIVDSTGNHVIETVSTTRISNKTVKYGTTAMYFNGTSDYCTIPYTTALNIPQSFTIEFWVYPIARLTSFPCILNNYSAYGGNGGFAIFAGHNSFSTSTYNVVFNGSQIINSTSGIVYNQWAHIALVRNGTTITLYVNGVANGTSTNQTATLVGTANSWWIGTAGDSIASAYFNGYVSDLRVSKSARYTAGFTPPAASLPTA